MKGRPRAIGAVRLRSFISAATAAFFFAAIVAPAFGQSQSIAYPSANPSSALTNVNARFVRHTVGDLSRDMLGPTISAAGTYGNLTVSPATGLFVTVGPTTAGTDGTLYQLGQVDPHPLPTGGATPNLPADTTTTIIGAQTNTASAGIGPLTAPGAGLSVYYLIEAQENFSDTNPQSVLFVTQNPNGSATQSFQTVNTYRGPVISYQLKAGTPASSSPTQPAADSGWVALGYALVPNGKMQILTSDITAAPALSGFAPNSAIVHVFPSTVTPDSGNAGVTGTIAANQLISTATTGTAPLLVNSTTTVPNLTAQYATAISPAPTPTAAAPLIQNGTWPNLTYSCPSCASSATTPLQDVGGVISIATPIPQSLGGTGTGTVTGLASGNSIGSVSGSFPNQTFTVAASPTFTALTTGALSASGTVTFSSLLSGCLQTNGSGVLSITTCGGGSGVSSVTGSAPIVSSGGSTPAISCATCVVLTPGSQQLGSMSISGSPTFGAGSGSLNVTVNAGSSGTGAGAAIVFQNGGSSTFAIGHESDILGGAYNNTPYFYSTGAAFTFNNAISTTGTVTAATGLILPVNSITSPGSNQMTIGNDSSAFGNFEVQNSGGFKWGYNPSGTNSVLMTLTGAGKLGVTGALNVGNAAATTAGDVGLGRSATTAIIFMGTSPTIDYGITTGSAFTLSGGPVNIKSNGLEVGPTINSVNTLGYVPPVYTAAGAATASTEHSTLVSSITTSGSTNTGCPAHGTWTTYYCGSASLTGAAAFASNGSASASTGNAAPSFGCNGGPWFFLSTHIFVNNTTQGYIILDDSTPNTIYYAITGAADQSMDLLCTGT